MIYLQMTFSTNNNFACTKKEPSQFLDCKELGLRVKATYNIKGKGCDLCNRSIVKSHAFQFPCCGQHGLMRFCSSFSKTFGSSFGSGFQTGFASGCDDVVFQYHHVVQVAVIGAELIFCHALQAQLLLGFCQAGGGGIFGYLARVEEVDPLVKGHLRPFVEVVHTKNEVLGIEVAHLIHMELLYLEGRQLENIARVDASEPRLAVIHRVGGFAQIEIDNVDAINLADVLIALTAVDVLGRQLLGAKQHAVEVGIL